MKMQSSVEVDRSAAQAFAVISDFSRNPDWQRGMKSATWTSDPPHGVGSTYDQVAAFMGRDVITSFEVMAYEQDRSVTIESTKSTFPIKVTRSVEPLGANRCRVSADIAGEPGGIFRLFSPIMGWVAKRSVDGDYKRLKSLLES